MQKNEKIVVESGFWREKNMCFILVRVAFRHQRIQMNKRIHIAQSAFTCNFSKKTL